MYNSNKKLMGCIYFISRTLVDYMYMIHLYILFSRFWYFRHICPGEVCWRWNHLWRSLKVTGNDITRYSMCEVVLSIHMTLIYCIVNETLVEIRTFFISHLSFTPHLRVILPERNDV